MDNYKLKFSKFESRLNGYKSDIELVRAIRSYFNGRLSNRIKCSLDELEQLRVFVVKIRNSSEYSKEFKDKITIEIEKLFVLTCDDVRYRTFSQLSEKRISDFSVDEILEYIDIVLSNCYCCIVVSKLDKYVRRYLELTDDTDKINNLIDKHSSVFSDKDLKYLNNFICNNSISIILRRILTSFDNENILFIDLYKCFLQLMKVKLGDISNNNLLLFRDILEKVYSNDLLVKIDNVERIDELRVLVDDVFDRLIDGVAKGDKIKSDIVSGNIEFTNTFSDDCISSIKINSYGLPLVMGERIITIDDPSSPDLDGAFSIQKLDDIYVLNVYVTDVPVFLRDNRKLCEEAYLRGNSLYIRDYKNNCNYNIDMLPQFLSHNYLSLIPGSSKDVITFKFIIGKDGNVYSSDVSRKSIMITNKLSFETADRIMKIEEDYGLLQEDLRNYKYLCNIVSKKNSLGYLSQLDCDSIYDLVGFTSILVNYYIGYNAEFAIYRNKGIYTLDSSSKYTHSVTPLRRFVSDINLAFFLEQKGVVHFPSSDLYYVCDNANEIIEHLNAKQEISKFVERNSNSKFIKKYVK